MAPANGTDRFNWQDMHEAQEAFALSLQGRLPGAELDSLRQALLAYGQRQTLALREIAALFESSETTHRRQSSIQLTRDMVVGASSSMRIWACINWPCML